MIRRILTVLTIVTFATILAAQAPASPTARMIREFFSAFNSGDAGKMAAFYGEAATEEFRSRRTAEEDRRLYDRLYGDLGPLEIRSVERDSPDEVRVTASSERMPEPVQFVFELRDDRIQGFSVRVGGPDGEGGPVLDLPRGADDATLTRLLDEQLRQLAADGEFSGVALLARDGKPVFHNAYGMANRAAGIANETSTRFDVGSITKLMTQIAIAQLLQSGKLGLDDTILDHIPDYPNPDAARRITVQQLVDHSSGLGDIFNDRWEAFPKDELVSPRAFFPLFADRPLRFEPGEGRAYSNAGFIVLGAIVEAASGQSYAEYMEAQVFRPAGMKRSGFPARDGKARDLAIGYTRHGGGDEAQPNLGMLPIRGCPAGSSSHTAEDLLKLDRALRAGKLLDPAWAAWVFTGSKPETPPSGEIGYPIGVAGGAPGVSAGLESDGETTAIVVSNLDEPIAEELAIRLYRALRSGD